MKTFLRLATVLAVACGLALVPSAAQAEGGCSTTKGVPNISVTYYYCSSYFDGAPPYWNSRLDITNHHGMYVYIFTEFQLKIDGDVKYDRISTEVPVDTGMSMFDPYNQRFVTDIRQLIHNSCTKGHTYFPSARVMVDGFSWGPWAGGHEFHC